MQVDHLLGEVGQQIVDDIGALLSALFGAGSAGLEGQECTVGGLG
jgi:hypothetical protein